MSLRTPHKTSPTAISERERERWGVKKNEGKKRARQRKMAKDECRQSEEVKGGKKVSI